MMGQAVEQRGGHLGVAEHARPFAEGEIGGDDDGSALVEPADQVEEQLAAGLSEGQIAEFVEHDEVHAGEIFASRPCRLARAGRRAPPPLTMRPRKSVRTRLPAGGKGPPTNDQAKKSGAVTPRDTL